MCRRRGTSGGPLAQHKGASVLRTMDVGLRMVLEGGSGGCCVFGQEGGMTDELKK